MINEKYMLAIACGSPKYLKDLIEAEALPEHQQALEDVYAIYKRTGVMPEKKSLLALYGIDFDSPNEWDIEKAYDLLVGINTEKFYNEATMVFSMGKNKDEEFKAIQEKYKRKYELNTGSQINISCHGDLLKALKKVSEDRAGWLKTGIKSLAQALNDDELLAWRQKTLNSVIGLSGIGKSIILINFARDNLENGYNVLYISTEMDEIDILERLAKSLYRVSDEREVVLKEQIPIGKLSIQKVHPHETTYHDIQGIIDSLDWKPNIIYIDYADELKSHEKATSEYDAQGIIYSGLKKLAETNDVPVVTATQTNRTAEGEEGGTKKYVGYSAVADSSKKIRLADTLFSIVQSPEEKKLGLINLSVVKNRKNTSGQKLPFYINYKQMRITEREAITPVVEKAEKEDMPKRRM